MSKNLKIRLDQLLVNKKLVSSKTKAQSMIMAGQVLVNDKLITKSGNSFDEETKIYISNLYDNILENKTWAENLISDNLDNWKLERVATLDQLIMRIAISEIYFNEDIPPKVSISEAIEIAKIYSTEDSSGFVNGVLDSIYQRKIVSD